MRTLSVFLIAAAIVFAQGRGPRPTPPIPALGIEVPAADRAELEAGLKRLQASTAKLAKHALAPDVLIYQEAVRYALQYNEFLKPDEIGKARKLAGEVDFFEALDAVKRAYPIDENRIVIRGFSMGGASAWHIGAHFAGLWAAVAPGAGFSESAQFLHLNLTGPDAPPAWEQQLYHLYDMNDYAINLANTATIAYNGEIDGQKQAADVMEKAMAEEGMRLTRVIGPQTPHRYHPDAKVEIDRTLDAIVA